MADSPETVTCPDCPGECEMTDLPTWLRPFNCRFVSDTDRRVRTIASETCLTCHGPAPEGPSYWDECSTCSENRRVRAFGGSKIEQGRAASGWSEGSATPSVAEKRPALPESHTGRKRRDL